MVLIGFRPEAETWGMNSAIASLIRQETEHEMGSYLLSLHFIWHERCCLYKSEYQARMELSYLIRLRHIMAQNLQTWDFPNLR